MHSHRVKQMWTRDPAFKRRTQRDIILVRQYSMLLAVLSASVVYRLLALVVVQVLYVALRCESGSGGSVGYVVTLSLENASFMSLLLWSAGAGASDGWSAGLLNRLALPLLQAVFLACFCGNLLHFFFSAVAFAAVATEGDVCWPSYFIGLLWGFTWLNVASFAAVAFLLANISSPMNLFTSVRQTDSGYEAPEPQAMDRA